VPSIGNRASSSATAISRERGKVMGLTGYALFAMPCGRHNRIDAITK
jgi:hypothetical protein